MIKKVEKTSLTSVVVVQVIIAQNIIHFAMFYFATAMDLTNQTAKVASFQSDMLLVASQLLFLKTASETEVMPSLSLVMLASLCLIIYVLQPLGAIRVAFV